MGLGVEEHDLLDVEGGGRDVHVRQLDHPWTWEPRQREMTAELTAFRRKAETFEVSFDIGGQVRHGLGPFPYPHPQHTRPPQVREAADVRERRTERRVVISHPSKDGGDLLDAIVGDVTEE